MARIVFYGFQAFRERLRGVQTWLGAPYKRRAGIRPLGQVRLAKALSVSPNTVSAWLRGRRLPTAAQMTRITALLCDATNDDPAWCQKLLADYAAFKASEKERRRALREARRCRCPECGHVHRPAVFYATEETATGRDAGPANIALSA